MSDVLFFQTCMKPRVEQSEHSQVSLVSLGNLAPTNHLHHLTESRGLQTLPHTHIHHYHHHLREGRTLYSQQT